MISAEGYAEIAAILVERTTHAQGLPEQVEDPVLLDRLAELLEGGGAP